MKRLADRHRIHGHVSNTAGGVHIEIETEDPQPFLNALYSEAPPNARIERCSVEELPPVGYRAFDIITSQPQDGSFTLISPDLATCADCLREIFDPSDRRYGYPFTNCTNCGPRYSITIRIPYDRPNTTMVPFRMCADCLAEYKDPGDRRFHAEPNACPVCGPRLSTEIAEAVAALERNEVVAVKSLGGFQLACNALSAEAVRRLRERKRRSRKPFAVMMPDLATVEKYCHVGPRERELLTGRSAPIVLLRMREPGLLPPDLAPGLRELGVMLPYTPLHHVLCRSVLVMTSGNFSEEPIVTRNEEALAKLAPLADLFLTHDRDIFMRVDDSVVRDSGVVRRARGYAPEPIDLGFETGEVLACGGELKNTFCITKDHYAILSQHIGDLENYETLQFFEESLHNLQSVYRAKPELIVHDLHPDYLSTRWALQRREPKLAVQHHHAHIASCMAENHLSEKVIGIAFDGTGYGIDGQIWGGEFLVGDYSGFERAAHLRYVPLVGGDRAIREGFRMAAAHLFDAFGSGYRDVPLPIAPATWNIFDRLFAAPALFTSSCGRLFDAVSAILGICHSSSYEGEAAMLLEAAAVPRSSEEYPFGFDGLTIDTRPMIRAVAAGRDEPGQASWKFHNTLAAIMEAVCTAIRERTGIEKVCLSGGTFQNTTLIRLALPRLQYRGFEVFTQSRVPPNDGGLSLGQAAIGSVWRKTLP